MRIHTYFDNIYLKKRQMLLLLLIGLFCLLFMRGMELRMKTSLSMDRMRLHAIPTAMSVLYHHHPHDYTGLRAIESPFQGQRSTKSLIQAAKYQSIGQDKSVYYWVADDKGLEDYVIASFYLFGLHLDSLYYMWFLMLLITVSLYLVSFSRQVWALSFLCLILLGFHLAISTLALAKFNWVLSIYESRVFDILALPAVMHMLFLSAKKKPLRWMKDVFPLMAQLLFFMTLYHARSSLGWEVVAVFSFCFIMICITVYKKNIRKLTGLQNNSGINSVIVAILLATSLLGLNLYKHMMYNPKYFVDSNPRSFWHNALMGLGQESRLFSTKYELQVDDGKIAEAVVNFARTTNKCTLDMARVEARQITNAFGGEGEINWYHYEHCAKLLFFSTILDNKREAAILFGFSKPYSTIHNFWIWMQNINPPQLDKLRIHAGATVGWHPMNIINFSIFLYIFFFAHKALFKARKKLMIISSIVLIFSMIPSIAFYNCIVTQGGMIVIAGVLFYLILTFFMSPILRRVTSLAKS